MRTDKQHWSVNVGLIVLLGMVASVIVVFLWLLRNNPIPSIQDSYIQANVPAPKDFQPFLVRDLTAYLKPKYGDHVTFGYDLLRDAATQAGTGYPYFYLWIAITNSETTAAVAEVAAMDKAEFRVTAFVPEADIRSRPDGLRGLFPGRLIPAIIDRAKK